MKELDSKCKVVEKVVEKSESVAIAYQLISKGAAKDTKDGSGKTVLDHAKISINAEIEYLLSDKPLKI